MNLTWEQVAERDKIQLYAGDIYPHPVDMSNLVGLSLTRSDNQHITHDVRHPIPLADGCVFSYQSEDVFEHILFNELGPVFDEIYRLLKPGGLFRLSMPDYRCDVLRERSTIVDGRVVDDPGACGPPGDPRHLWFPIIETTSLLFERSKFEIYSCLHGYHTDGRAILNVVDYSKGYISRTPDNDKRVMDPRRPMSIIVDAYK